MQRTKFPGKNAFGKPHILSVVCGESNCRLTQHRGSEIFERGICSVVSEPWSQRCEHACVPVCASLLLEGHWVAVFPHDGAPGKRRLDSFPATVPSVRPAPGGVLISVTLGALTSERSPPAPHCGL